MGIIPLQFRSGENAESLKLTGHEIFDINIPQNCKPLQEIKVTVNIIYFCFYIFKNHC